MKLKQHQIVGLVLLGVSAVGVHWWRSTATHTRPSAGAVVGNVGSTPAEESVAGQWVEGVVSLRQPDFVQEYTVHGGGDFVVVDETLNAATGVWTQVSYASNVTFDPYVFASAGRDYFAVGGIDHATNDTVIERLRLVTKIAVPGSPPAKTFVRTQIYRGSISQPPVALGIDPDKRFLLYLCADGSGRQLYQIALQANATPVLLYNAASQPVLSQAWMLNPLEHVSLGRIWVVSGMTSVSTGETLILVDSNNDSVFEAPPISDTHDYLMSSGLLAASQISDPFVDD